MPDFAAWSRAIQTRMEIALAGVVPAETVAPERLHAAMRYLTLGGGKRVRPMLAFAAGEAVQVEGVVERQEIVARPRRTLVVDLRDDTGAIALRFFHFYGSQLRQFASGNRVRNRIGEAICSFSSDGRVPRVTPASLAKRS